MYWQFHSRGVAEARCAVADNWGHAVMPGLQQCGTSVALLESESTILGGLLARPAVSETDDDVGD